MRKDRDVHNEQIKLIAGVLQTMGTGLFIAAVGLGWSSGINLEVVSFGIGSIFVWIMAYASLGLMRGE